VVRTAAVFFDVDFTLIHPGPWFQGPGYQTACARHGMRADAALFDRAVTGAAAVLDGGEELYDAEIFVRYTQRIIELMGGDGPAAETVARELCADWAAHHHFWLYDDVVETLQALADRGIRLGLISNSHRCLVSFQAHFALDGLISVAVSSAELGYLKPHPRIFRAALERMRVTAGAAVMVGDSLPHDVLGARRAGMRGVLLVRGGRVDRPHEDVPVITSLRELVELI
jgi:HAD superfamily hydrolase (TIGR01662 family)